MLDTAEQARAISHRTQPIVAVDQESVISTLSSQHMFLICSRCDESKSAVLSLIIPFSVLIIRRPIPNLKLTFASKAKIRRGLSPLLQCLFSVPSPTHHTTFPLHPLPNTILQPPPPPSTHASSVDGYQT